MEHRASGVSVPSTTRPLLVSRGHFAHHAIAVLRLRGWRYSIHPQSALQKPRAEVQNPRIDDVKTMTLPINEIICGDNVKVLEGFPSDSIDLVVTSPPYGELRDYNGYQCDFYKVAKQLFRVIKPGGVIVWVVGDQTTDGDESGVSFEQALYFKSLGLRLLDTMIYSKNPRFPESVRYNQAFEYMFVFSSGAPSTVNLIADKKNTTVGQTHGSTHRAMNGEMVPRSESFQQRETNEFGVRPNIWHYQTGGGQTTTDKIAFKHSAIFPEKLAADHIKSWSNEGDIVLDPMNGSGTTTKMAREMGRRFIGIEISAEYCELANKRLAQGVLF